MFGILSPEPAALAAIIRLSYFVNIACWVVVTCGCGNGAAADRGTCSSGYFCC